MSANNITAGLLVLIYDCYGACSSMLEENMNIKFKMLVLDEKICPLELF